MRREYDRLPAQWFWTWVTGKGRLLDERERERALRPLGDVPAMLHLVLSWLVIAAALWGADTALDSGSLLLASAAVLACWLVVVNRARSLQACFHYMTHGSVMPSRRLARLAATVAFCTPFFYQSWRAYCRTHVAEHHHLRVLCSEQDPDQRFIAEQGFHPGMREGSFWWRIWLRPFVPTYLAGRLHDAWTASVVEPAPLEKAFRIGAWTLVLAVCAAQGWLGRFVLLFFVPAFVLFQHSLWLQLVTEHLWFARLGVESGTPAGYGRLTWGRFQGRPLPRQGGLFAWAGWWLRLLLCDVPVRLYVYPQDLPNHDFHHRLPVAPYHAIADLRRTSEAQAGRFGPTYEVWGFLATLRVMRDHLCRGDVAPFRFPPAQTTH